MTGNSTYDHSAIVTEFQRQDLMWWHYVNTHTVDRYHEPWDSIFFYNVKFIKISGV